MGNRGLKLMVILLCSINAATWELYTESRFMAIMWAAIVVAFVIWLIDDVRR
jgi:uncharacterized membrane protein YvlD (DUF360 family)